MLTQQPMLEVQRAQELQLVKAKQREQEPPVLELEPQLPEYFQKFRC